MFHIKCRATLPMKRRDAIRNLAIISATAAFFASCQDKSSVALKNISVTGSEEEMIATLAESIIPKTTFPGAKDLKSPEFVFTMVDDCMSPEDQQRFLSGMKQFNDAFGKSSGIKFTKATPDQRNEFLKSLEASKDDDDVKKFYRTVKRYTVQSFTSSPEYMQQVRNYKMIPGPFHGCLPIPA
jgi:Gluconate 2-dehydrogenase subunit 3